MRSSLAASCLVSALVAAVLPAAAEAAPAAWVVSAPSAPVSARLALDGAGALTFGVDVRGQTVLAPAPVGVQTATADLTTGLTFLSRRDRVVRDRYTTTTGKRRERQTVMTESTFGFMGTGGAR